MAKNKGRRSISKASTELQWRVTFPIWVSFVNGSWMNSASNNKQQKEEKSDAEFWVWQGLSQASSAWPKIWDSDSKFIVS